MATIAGAAAIGTVIRGARSPRSTPSGGKRKIRAKLPLSADAGDTRARIVIVNALPGSTVNAEALT
jgi:hypothetical protein